jgi:hypothetical protein
VRFRVVRTNERPGFAAAADALLAGDAVELPEPRLHFLDWLHAARGVVFHGSPRGDLTELSTQRRSQDTTEWGNQEAVYASSDPVWSTYFAVLRRDNGWTGTRNGSFGIGRVRFYVFAHNRGSESPDRFGPGTLYVLPGDTFVAQKARIDTAHLVSPVPVRPLARLAVTPADFPCRDALTYFREDEPIWMSILRP